MNARLEALCTAILTEVPPGADARREISLDALSDRLGGVSGDAAEIAWVIETLEAAGCEVVSPPSDAGPTLHAVLPLARDLRVTLGRAPTAEELADAAGVSVEAVRTALFFGRVMGRG
jgi:hypothetical protein